MAATVVSVPANEGISVKNERDDPEINAMALKMKETFQKNASQASLRMGTASNVYINRAGKAVPLIPVAQLSKMDTPKDIEDIESVKCRFGWTEIGNCYVPYLIRIINGEYLKFVSVRIAENQLLSMYLNYLHPDIYTCTSVKSHFITEAEAKLLNDINVKHCEQIYGKEQFQASKDYIVRLEDVQEFYTFIEVCYKKLLCQDTKGAGRKELCGFIRINSESVVPYCIKDEQKYVPLFYFEGETDNLRHRAIKLENWSLAYLKFCCKVQGIRNELFASDSCIVTSLEDIKSYFPPDTNFEEYWPAKVVDTQLLTNQKTTHMNPPAAWIRAPPALHNKVPAPESILPRALPVPAPSVVPPPNVPLTNNTYQNGWASNQMVNSYNIQAQSMPARGYIATSRNQGVAAQYYNSGSAILQQSNGSMNNVNHVPPPLVRAGTTSVVSNAVPYSNSMPISQSMTTMYNPMSTGSTTSHSNPMQQFYRSAVSNHGQVLQQQQQQQSYVYSTTQSQQTYNNPSLVMNGLNSRITNTQPRNALRNVMSTAVIPSSEIIDLSSPPSSPTPQVTQESYDWELTKIPERPWANEQTNVAYKMQKATLQGKMIHCINAKPYRYSDLMVTLSDLVQTLTPSCTVQRCAHILNKYLKTTLYSANSEQLAVLRENGRLKSLNSDDTPMAMLQDINQVVLQLKNLVNKHDEHIQMSPGGLAKRPRLS